MVTDGKSDDLCAGQNEQPEGPAHTVHTTKVPKWRQLLGKKHPLPDVSSTSDGSSTDGYDEAKAPPEKWSMGVLNDKQTEEVPGKSCMLLFGTAVSPLELNRALDIEYWSSAAGNRLT